MNTVKQIWILGILAVLSWEDVRAQLLSLRWLLLLILTGIPIFVLRLWDCGIGSAATLLPGLFLLLISLFGGGALGMGDALTVLGLGLYFEGNALWSMLALSMCLSMVWAGILLIKRKNGKQTIPMVPFLLAGYVGGMYLWKIG